MTSSITPPTSPTTIIFQSIELPGFLSPIAVSVLTSSITPPTSPTTTAVTNIQLPSYLPSSIAVPVLTSSITPPTSNHTGITTSPDITLSSAPVSSTFKAYNPGPVSPVTFSEVKTSHMGITTSPDITLSSAPVSSTFKAYNPGPVSPVTFSEVKTSFSAIAVSSNILTAEVFLYGAYVVMFGLYLKVLRSGGIAKNRGLTVATILLFILCTAHCALQISTSTLYNQAESRSIGNSEALFDQTFKDYSSVVIATNAVYVTSNIIADTIFILRCYAIWNFQLKIVFVPVLLTFAVADLVVAEFSFKLLKISILLSICTTVILMVLTAGRIWWIAQTARTLLGRTAISKYHTACAMILESGAIYCVSAIAFATIGFTLDQVYWTTGAILGQVVGIAPTIIAVRVGLGHSVSSVESFEVMTQGGEIYASLPQSRTKGARSGDEEAVEDPYRRSRKHARRFNLNTTSTSSLMRPGSVLYIRSDDSI
ncbi:hypothetical protein B0H16DRAFT_454906 [Mycena metata]|uniref:Uncharacterized protein n=1 Tax=Mycena metata TaxID=1033252 RepID=A0AAD7JHT5_9AGAR|nr:hypothetical protein B0H16DRAFT_454906 [Mycena metata]